MSLLLCQLIIFCNNNTIYLLQIVPYSEYYMFVHVIFSLEPPPFFSVPLDSSCISLNSLRPVRRGVLNIKQYIHILVLCVSPPRTLKQMLSTHSTCASSSTVQWHVHGQPFLVFRVVFALPTRARLLILPNSPSLPSNCLYAIQFPPKPLLSK